jgi:hypothetical protein
MHVPSCAYVEAAAAIDAAGQHCMQPHLEQVIIAIRCHFRALCVTLGLLRPRDPEAVATVSTNVVQALELLASS